MGWLSEYLDGGTHIVDPSTAPEAVRRAIAPQYLDADGNTEFNRRHEQEARDAGVQFATDVARDSKYPAPPSVQQMAGGFAEDYRRAMADAPPGTGGSGAVPPAPGVMGDVKLKDWEAPAAKPKKAPKVSVGMPAAREAPAPFAALAHFMPRADGAPQAAPQPQGDAELERAQKLADLDRTTSHIGGVIDRGARLSIGAPTDGEVFARGEANADTRIRDLMQKRDALRQRSEDAQKTLEQGRTNALYDEDSDVSKRATMLAHALKLVPPGTKITASQWGALQGGAGIEAQREAAAANNKLAEAQLKDTSQRGWAELRSHASDAAANRDLQRYIHQSDKAADYQRALMEAEAKKREKAGEAAGAPVAPGYVRGDIPLKDQELEKFRAAVDARDDVKGSVAALKALYKDNGAQVFGDTRAKYDSLGSNIRLKLKNLAELGALSGSDLALMDAQIPEVGGVGGYFTGTDTTNAKLDQLSTNLDNSVDSKAHALGLRAPGPAAQAPHAAPAPHPQDSQAVEWAKANPHDPRAAAILKANGVQ